MKLSLLLPSCHLAHLRMKPIHVGSRAGDKDTCILCLLSLGEGYQNLPLPTDHCIL